ncbi:TFIIH complex kinase subunit CCL1 [Aspergillus alliaceus]|uniref:TFIIH complex kinase subunit CCL1 n=1 Tax=Petromyces alliaceus TaxID=209559 RepID=UPI0012A49CD4|nr:cyclin-like protein [Aspergillus alliaceus]KAB8237571.1 cyclin-like protein [Aspergillus alliaceus]
MIEDDFYRSSSQFRLWSYTESSLKSLRAATNANASERVRSALRKSRGAQQSATSSAAGTPAAHQIGSDADSKTGGEDAEVECLTPDEEHQLVRYFCEQIIELGEMYKPPLPTIVRATAIQYLRRFYLTNSPMTYHPKSIMLCALFLATKTDNYYLSLRQFAEVIPGDTTAEELIQPEFLVMQSLRFTFDVRHPFRGLEGGIMELQAIAQGMGQPSPHFPTQTPDDLKRRLHSLPPSQTVSSINDRLARAHHTTRETLKSAAQMTDAYFLYTPSQIWLAAFMLADRPLAEFYLDTKLGGPVAEGQQQENPLYQLRTKLLRTLTDCSNLLQAYTPLASDPDQKKNLRRIRKKLYHCQNPEKADLAGQKRIPAAAAAAVAAAGDPATSESEMERLAKKRKLEGGQPKDMFGGELVTQRTKESQPQ